MFRTITAVCASALLMATPTVAAAAPGGAPGTNPVAYCKANVEEVTNPVTGITLDQYIVPVEFTFGNQTVVEDFGLSSFQACVSTVASGMRDGVVPASAITTPAYIAQCDFLVASGFISYPYDFYGVYPATKRADCVKILKGVHSGELALPGGPPVG